MDFEEDPLRIELAKKLSYQGLILEIKRYSEDFVSKATPPQEHSERINTLSRLIDILGEKAEPSEPDDTQQSGHNSKVIELEEQCALFKRNIKELRRKYEQEEHKGNYEEKSIRRCHFDLDKADLMRALRMASRRIEVLAELSLKRQEKLREKWRNEVAKRRKEVEIFKEYIRNIMVSQKDSITSTRVNTQELNWMLLPPGKHDPRHIVKCLEGCNKGRNNIFDLQRIESIVSLNPKACYVGHQEWDSYVVFCFPDTPKAILDCPMYGNALYVIRNGWQAYAKLSKAELLFLGTDIVRRIIHVGDWLERVRCELQTKGV